jgi:hypothetical protein
LALFNALANTYGLGSARTVADIISDVLYEPGELRSAVLAYTGDMLMERVLSTNLVADRDTVAGGLCLRSRREGMRFWFVEMAEASRMAA